MTVPAGWYPDPQVQNTLRYWDGASWTEHRAPAHGGDGGAQPGAGVQPGVGAPGPALATERLGQPRASYGSAPAPGASDLTAPYDPAQLASGGGYHAQSSATGGYGAGPAGGAGASSVGGYGTYGQSAPAPSGGSRTGLFIGLGVAALVLVLVLVFAVRLLSGIGGPAPDPTAAPTPAHPRPRPPGPPPTPSPTDTPPAGGESFAPGDTVQVEVPANGEATFTYVIGEPGVYWLDTFSPDGEVDPVLEVSGPDGAQWRDDDDTRDSDNNLDASLTMALAAGEYQVSVTDLRESGTGFELRSGGAQAEAVEPGEQDFSVSAEGTWLARVPISAGQTITVDVHDTSADSVAAIAFADGTYEENDDRRSSAPRGDTFDPYVEATATADGDALIMIWGYLDRAVEGSVTITVE